MEDKNTQRSMGWLLVIFVLAVVPLELAVSYALWLLGMWTLPLFVVTAMFFLVLPQKSRTYMKRVTRFRSAGSIRANVGQREAEPVSLPRPPLMPTRLEPAQPTPSSTMPCPVFEVPRNVIQFEEAVRRLSSRPAPSISTDVSEFT